MVALGKISSDLNLTETKKSTLRQAFADLQALSASISSFFLTWSDIDSHFSSLQSEIEHRYQELLTHVSEYRKHPQSAPSSSPSSRKGILRPELKSFCVEMNGVGLQKYIVDRPLERKSMRNELGCDLQCAPDPAALVLSSLDGFFPKKPPTGKDLKLDNLRMACILLLDELMNLKPELKPEVQDKARELAMVWKEKASKSEEKRLEAIGFLNLLAAYNIGSDFEVEEVIPFFVTISKSFQAIRLCHEVLARENVPGLIQKLVEEGKELVAVKYVFEFGLTDKFPPIPLLKSHVEEIKKVVARVLETGKGSLQSLNEATSREISGLIQVIKLVDDNGLQSEFPKSVLTRRLEQLEKIKADRKRTSKSAPSPALPPKKRKITAPNNPPTHSSSLHRAAPLYPLTRPSLYGSVGPTLFPGDLSPPSYSFPSFLDHPSYAPGPSYYL